MLFDLSAVFSRQQGAFFLRNHLPTSADSPNRKYLMRITSIISVLLLTSISFVSAHAASSTNVSLTSDLYSDMELWAAEGLIESNLSSIKPFARSEVGRQLVEALDNCNAQKNPSATCLKIKRQYAKLFETEITEARSPENISGTFLKPIENFSVSYNYLKGPFTIYNNEGIHYGEGQNALVQLQAEARLWGVLSFFVQPALIYNQHSGWTFTSKSSAYSDSTTYAEDGGSTNLQLHKGYVKLNIYNFEVEVGRDSLWWGPGYHAALLMSNNAPPMDMIKLSNPEPVLLPWIFSYLGPVQFNLIFSQLNDERTGTALANPFLYGLRLGIKPHSFLELGASHLVMFGGPGRRDMNLGDIITTLYSNTNRDNLITDSNQEFAVDFALTIPNIKKYVFLVDGIKLYCEVGAEDSGNPPDRRAYIAGFALYKPFALERTVFRGEYAILSPYSVPLAWYNHGSYPMRYEGQVFGDYVGTDAEDIFVEWSQDFEKFFYKLAFERERSGIQTQTYPQFTFQYSGEIGYRLNSNSNITLRYAYEDINNLGNVQGERQRNQFLGAEYAIYF
jgi:hypothetical protein